ALGDFHLLAAAHDGDHLVQHVVGPALRNADAERLQAGAHTGDGAVVIGALLVDDTLEAALPLVGVVGDIGHEVGITAVALAHDAVLVIAEAGGAQPQRAIFFIGMAAAYQRLHRIFHF